MRLPGGERGDRLGRSLHLPRHTSGIKPDDRLLANLDPAAGARSLPGPTSEGGDRLLPSWPDASVRLIREWPLLGRAVAPGGALAEPGLADGSLGGRRETDLVAEGFDLCDQSAGMPVEVEAAGEEIGAKIVVGRAAGKDVPDDDEHRVRDHDDRFLLDGRAAGSQAYVRALPGVVISALW